MTLGNIFTRSHFLVSTAAIALVQWLQNQLFPSATFESPVWIVAGISLGICYLAGLKQVFDVFFAIFFGCLIGLLINEPQLSNTVIWFGIIYSLCLCTQTTAIYLSCKQVLDETNPIGTSKAFIKFFVICLVATVFTSTLLSINSYFFLNESLFELEKYLSLLLANFMGIIIFCPFLIAYAFRQNIITRDIYLLEYFTWGISVIALGAVSFFYSHANIILLTPLLIWASVRFGTLMFTAALPITSVVIAITTTTESHTITSLSFEAVPYWFSGKSFPLMWGLLVIASLYFNNLLSDKVKTERKLEKLVRKQTLDIDISNQELKGEIFIREQAERSLRTTSKRYKALIETAGIPIIVLDQNICIRQWNMAAESTFGYSREQVLSNNFIDQFIPQNNQDDMAWKLTRILESAVDRDTLECEVLVQGEAPATMLWNINLLPNISEEPDQGQFLLIGQNISSMRKTQDQLHYLAHFDTLTGCANRRLFEDRCEQAIHSAVRHRHEVALIGLDIDHFKRINDTLGHAAGDEFLVTLADRLKQCVRREDTIARLGGDEFAVLLANVNGQDGAETVARNILDTIIQPVMLKGTELVVTSSIGITLCPTDGTYYPDLLKNADMAMYRAKNAGRNNIQFYSPEMNDEMQRQLQIEQELRHAIKENQFQTYYQPIIDIETGEVVALESLLRWNHPQKGILKPDYFLQVAEQSGLLQKIGQWALENTCIEGKAIQELSTTPIQIALNLSNRQYNHPGLLGILEEVTQKTGFSPRNLILEMSENTITSNAERSFSTLHALKQLGVSLTIDSFGTGLSSLQQLRQIPIDIIKIDRTFVNGIPQDQNDMTITETLLTIATQMDLKTFATGVETKEQEAFLKINGCRYAQGYLYSAPLPYAKLTQLFQTIQAGETLRGGDQIYLPFDSTGLNENNVENGAEN